MTGLPQVLPLTRAIAQPLQGSSLGPAPLVMDFRNPASVDGQYTFTRASGGGRFNAQGQYEWLPANEPRIDYDPVTGECRGLLIEEQRTNLLTYSNNPPAHGGTASASSSTLILGENSFAYTADGSTGPHFVSGGVSVTSGVMYTLSAYVKRGARRYLYVRATGALGEYGVVFDLENGAVVSASTGIVAKAIEPAGGGVYRIWLSVAVVSSGSGLLVLMPSPHTYTAPNRNVTYVGDGQVCFYVAKRQIETGTFPTSYIPTTTAQVTRAADIAGVNELSPWYNPASGTFVIDHDVPAGRPVLSSGANIIATSQGPGKLVVAYDAIASYVSHNGSPYITGPALVFSSSIDILRSPSAYANARGQSVAYYPRVLSVGDA